MTAPTKTATRMLTTTLKRIRAQSPRKSGLDDWNWDTLIDGLGKTETDDEPLAYPRIVEITRLDYALFACRAEPKYDKHWRLFAVWCARQVEHLMKDERSRAALHAAEQHVNEEVSDEELEAAWNAAGSASINAGCYRAAHAAAKSAEYAASPGAGWAAERAAEEAVAAVGYARDEKWGVELTPSAAALASSTAVRAAAWSSSWGAKADAHAAAQNAERVAQTLKFIEICNGNDR
jgi:hypothetical protein